MVGSIAMPVGPAGPFFEHFEDWLCDWVAGLIADSDGKVWVGFESPFLAGARWDPKAGRMVKAATSIATLRKLYGLATFVELVCFRFNREYGPGVECREVQNGTIKKLLTGHGKADKVGTWGAARKLGVQPQSDDEADAFGGWLEMVKHYGAPEHWDTWHRRLCAIGSVPDPKPASRSRKAKVIK